MPCLAEPRTAPHGAHRLASPRDTVHRGPDENDHVTGHPQVVERGTASAHVIVTRKTTEPGGISFIRQVILRLFPAKRIF